MASTWHPQLYINMSEETDVVETKEAPAAETLPTETPAFDAKWDRQALIDNAPDDIDREKFGKWTEKMLDPYAAFKSNLHAEKKISEYANADKLLDPEKKDDLLKALGRPDDASGYEFGEDLGVAEGDAEGIKAAAHRLGLNQDGANEMVKVINELKEAATAHQNEQNELAEENTVKYLESIWGNHQTEAYQNNLDLVEDVLSSKGIEVNSPEGDAIMRNGKVVELLNELGKMMDQSELPRVKSGDLSTAQTLEADFKSLSAQIMKAHEQGDQKTVRELEPKRRKVHAKLQRARR